MPDADIERLRRDLLARPRPTGLLERRARLNAVGAQYSLPSDVAREPTRISGVAAEWTSTPQADAGRVLLYLHGGAYSYGSIESHRVLVAEAGRQAGCRTLALEYRLAPEHPYPAALEDALAAYRYLRATGIDARRIAIGGDSAGGGLALATLVALRDAGDALPSCGWCISPWVDLEMTGPSMQTKAAVDPMIQKPYLVELVAAYLAGADARDPLVSPMYADLRGLPPLLIQVGSAETLLDDALRLAGVAGAADVAVRLTIYPEMIHAWPLFHQQVAMGRRALVEAGHFMRDVANEG